ncbi:hypothetical protein A5757_10355 [Mycobacterium sp. 852013-51886_SCH5428379]|uniref:hypothetical protein n=1 Tax=Mycobacterium sp. 852013-51886_SCH5428379 TaxID=1834111 RepID=UPI0008024EDD|nr:hypothetical protein [Mycobacterium sp. 852013-51886_SCH5428379]OBB60067.1 hypothetical protein A5757_10355 [Mycobacterium sp. 852013-51886_SCH5428379]
MGVYWRFTTIRGVRMLSRVAAVIAGIVAAGTRGTDNRRLDIRRASLRRRHREEFDDLSRDSRLQHQVRVDDTADITTGGDR